MLVDSVKRLFDATMAALGLVLVAPLLGAVAVLIRLDSPGPVIFKQTRIGRGLQPFTIYKLRTMTASSEPPGAALTRSGDPRITRVGHWLRRAKIDELPQLFNVLRGDMSLVGPRPELPEYVDAFRDGFARLLRARPGITDPASIRYRNESALLAAAADPDLEYRERILPDKLRLSTEYAEHSTLRTDIALIFQTLFGFGRDRTPDVSAPQPR
jgi:lipopolysaccharide/colanic/teichoic acid biosynthesis glycosyltransferase